MSERGKSIMADLQKQGVRYMFYPDQLAPSPHFGAAGASGISLFAHSPGFRSALLYSRYGLMMLWTGAPAAVRERGNSRRSGAGARLALADLPVGFPYEAIQHCAVDRLGSEQ